MTQDTNTSSGAEEQPIMSNEDAAMLEQAAVLLEEYSGELERAGADSASQAADGSAHVVRKMATAWVRFEDAAATPAERDLTGAALASIRHLLQADPAAHAGVAIQMIDAMLLATVAVPPAPAPSALEDAARLDFIESAPEGCVRLDANGWTPRYIYWGAFYKEARRHAAGNFIGPTLRTAIDAAMASKKGGE